MGKETPVNVLILDDDIQFCKMLCRLAQEQGCITMCRHNLKEGLDAARHHDIDVVLLDVNLPDGSGLDILTRLKKLPRRPEVIIMTGFGERHGAEVAIQNGAWDYIQKTGSHHKIILTLTRVMQFRRQQRRSPEPSLTSRSLDLSGIVGRSKSISHSLEQAAKAAGSPANVLISGATGTGKEVFARMIHRNSKRSQGNMVVVDCAALPETLVESMLFGHIKGAFTGADKGREGLVAQADGGTLFLDEVGEMPLAIQKVFLRVLQERRFRPVGGSRELPSDFRLIAATNQDLDQMAAKGTFRKDLLYRIRSLQVELPKLAARPDDIEPMARHYIRKICRRHEIPSKEISPDFFEALVQYNWPGNVRELINTLEIVISNNAEEPTLFARHLPEAIRLYAIHSTLEEREHVDMPVQPDMEAVHVHQLPSLKVYRKMAAARAEREYLQLLIGSVEQDVKTAQNIAGLSRSRFYELIKQHDLPVPHLS